MDFSFSEDQQGVRALAKQVLGGIVTDESLKALGKKGGWFHERAYRQLGESGLLGLALPEAYGGAGMGLTELCLLLQQVGRTAAPIPAIETAIASLVIAEYGSDEQKTRWLTGVVSGETILTVAQSQVDARDPERPSARATQDGDRWRVSGVFTNVAYTEQAARILVPARAGDDVVLVLVDPRGSGVRLGQQRGTSGQPLSFLELDNAAVGDEDVVARGRDALRFVVDRTRLSMCAVQVGVAEQALFLTAGYSAERKQFGVPIATFQGVTQRVGDAYIDVQAMKATMWQACWRLDQGLEARTQIAIAKFWASEGGARVVAAAQHVHGGMGFDRDYPLYRYFFLSKHLEFALGGATEQLTIIGDHLAAQTR